MKFWRAGRALLPGWRKTTLMTLLVAGAVAVIVSGLTRLQIQTSVESFIASDQPDTKAYDEVAAAFGGDPVVLLLESERPGTLLSGEQLSRLLALEGRLAELPDVAAVYGPATVLNQLAGQAQSLLAELIGRRDGIRANAETEARAAGASPDNVRAEGTRALAQFDQRYGVLVVQGLPTGLPTLHNDRFVRSVVYDAAGDPRPRWRFVVPSGDAVSILIRPRQHLSQEAVEALVGQVRKTADGAHLDTRRITVSGVPTVVAAIGERARHEVPLLGGIALLAVGAWFLSVGWTRWRWRLLPLFTTVTATGLTLAAFGWLNHPLSLGVIAFLPVLLGIGSDFMTYLHRQVGRRIVASLAIATAASFASLAATPIPAVRELGLTLALGMVLSLLVGLATARLLPVGTAAVDLVRPSAGGPSTDWPERRAASLKVRIVSGVVAGVLAFAGWAVLPLVPLRADMDSFATGLPALGDAQHVAEVIGSSGEVVLAVSGKETVTPQSLGWMQRAQGNIVVAHGDRLHPALSPPDLMQFLGTAPTAEELNAGLRLLPLYLSRSVIREDHGLSILSFGVNLTDAEGMRALRDDVLRNLPVPPEGLRVALTGLPMVALSAYEIISRDRYLTNVLGILAAGLVLAVGLRRRADALRAVAAAALATGIGLLVIWAVGFSLTPITVALGSLTAAVGCEFTVVLAEAARRRTREIRRAVLLAAAASGTGYAVLTLSELSLVRGFGAMLAGSVGLALLSAAFVVWLTVGPGEGQIELSNRESDDSANGLLGRLDVSEVTGGGHDSL